jgi:16S rRNA (cytosine1402-N4)-methyltransferase
MAEEAELHRPVLLSEALEALAVVTGGVCMDLTYGRGGHAAAILERLGPAGRLVVMDQDPEAIAAAQERFGADARVTIRHGSFAGAATVAAELGLAGRVNSVLMDLGVSSTQLDDPRRGFSFMRDGPLDMRMNPGAGVSAAGWLAHARETEIAHVLREYGEERYAKRIARAIVIERLEQPILTTGHLRAVVARANPSREPGKDPATRTFQAIRIHINHELEALGQCLDSMPDLLAPGGRLAVISFHSLEDRIVKRFIRRHARGDEFPRGLPVRDAARRPRLRAVGKAIHPGSAEIDRNPRARSAVLRVAEKLQ